MSVCTGRVHPSHRLLLLLVLCTQVTALAECDTPAARTEAEALQPTIQRIAAASGNQADHILASLARARCWRRGREPHDEIAVGDPNFVDHRAAVMSAFQVSSEFTVPRTQLVVSALRALAPMLIATGCVPAPNGQPWGQLGSCCYAPPVTFGDGHFESPRIAGFPRPILSVTSDFLPLNICSHNSPH